MSINDRDLASDRVEELLGRLNLEEKIRLLTGSSMWEMHPAPAVGLGVIRMSDGPVGVRGLEWDERDPALNLPNPSSIASTWDEDAARTAGRALGAESRRKGVHILLAPTVGLHRSPLGGRNFESWSEDPYLTARLSVAFVEGVQSQGVAATAKHFAYNDTDTDRMEYDAVIDEDVRHELYLRPFEDLVKAGVWAVMSSYNRVDGIMVSDHRALTHDLLKEHWGFDGLVMSDWFANRSVVASARSGLDVSMPGPISPWTEGLLEAVRSGEVPESDIDEKVRRILRLADRTGALSPGGALPTAEPLDDDSLAVLTARSMVLMINDGILPLSTDAQLLIIGEPAIDVAPQGGGSAHVDAATISQPLDVLLQRFGDATFVHGPRVKRIPGRIPATAATDPVDGSPGFRLEYLSPDGSVVRSEHRMASDIASLGDWNGAATEARLRFDLEVQAAGAHEVVVFGSGEFMLEIGGVTVGQGSIELDGVDLIEGLVRPPHRSFDVQLEAGWTPVALSFAPSGIDTVPIARFGMATRGPLAVDDDLIRDAVEAARKADVVLIVAGTTDDVEAEGFDRPDMRLPGRQDELISAVVDANPRTVVAVNAGASYELPWSRDVAALLWMGFPGEAGGRALADVVSGVQEPWGRLTTTFVARLEDAAVPSAVPQDGRVHYSERRAFGHRRVGVGTHRGEVPDPAFPFGHGLGFTDWEFVSAVRAVNEGSESVSVVVRNVGARDGREVVQVYLVPPKDVALGDAALPRLVGFGSVRLSAGESATIDIEIDPRAAGRYDADVHDWVPIDGGTLVVGRSSMDSEALEVKRTAA